MDSEPVAAAERSLFVGTRGGDVLTFVCLAGGGYGVRHEGQLACWWGDGDPSVALAAYLGMIDRPPGAEYPPPPT